MANSTKIRPLSRLIDKASSPFWVIGPDGRLVFLSAAVGDWLTVEPESLVGRLCFAGASITDDPLDFLAASLAAPPGLSSSGTASLVIQPTFPGAKSRRIAALDTRFVRLGTGSDRAGADGTGADSMTLAIGGVFADQPRDPIIEAAVTLRQQLDGWRRHHETVADGVAVGNSRAAKRIQNQIHVAGSVRSNVMILSPAGCFAESIASTVHQRAAPGEPSVLIDGPLMDSELLDASLGAVIHHLSDSDRTTATGIVNEIDQMPLDAQQRLTDHVDRFGERLRLIAIASQTPRLASSSTDPSESDAALFVDDSDAVGIAPALGDSLCGLTIRLCPLADRIVDLPMIATAMLDRRRANGDGNADRFSRAALDALVIYPWPDNLRELDQAIRHAARSCRAEVISPEHLPLAIRSYRPNESVPLHQQTTDFDDAVERYEAKLIRDALVASDGNRAEAARRLNISRARLLRKLELHDGRDF